MLRFLRNVLNTITKPPKSTLANLSDRLGAFVENQQTRDQLIQASIKGRGEVTGSDGKKYLVRGSRHGN